MPSSDIEKGDIVFYNDPHEAWMTNLITEVLEVKGENIVVIRTRGSDAEVSTAELIKIPVDKSFPIYSVTRYKPQYESPD